MAALYGIRHLGQRAFGAQEISRNIAALRRILGARGHGGTNAGHQHQPQDRARVGVHSPPPAKSALPTAPFVLVAPLSATRLYHEITHATPHMIRIPEKLTRKCS